MKFLGVEIEIAFLKIPDKKFCTNPQIHSGAVHNVFVLQSNRLEGVPALWLICCALFLALCGFVWCPWWAFVVISI